MKYLLIIIFSFLSINLNAAGSKIDIPKYDWSWKGFFGTYDRASAERGLKVHSMIQEYFTTEYKHLYSSSEESMPTSHRCDSVLANGLFMNMLGYLEMIDDIVFIETELYSDTYKIHGRVDCIAKIKGYNHDEGYLAVIDFKTSNKPKQSIKDNYGVQLCAYAVMYNEMFNENIENVVLISADETGGSQMIRRDVKKFMPTFEEWVVF